MSSAGPPALEAACTRCSLLALRTEAILGTLPLCPRDRPQGVRDGVAAAPMALSTCFGAWYLCQSQCPSPGASGPALAPGTLAQSLPGSGTRRPYTQPHVPQYRRSAWSAIPLLCPDSSSPPQTGLGSYPFLPPEKLGAGFWGLGHPSTVCGKLGGVFQLLGQNLPHPIWRFREGAPAGTGWGLGCYTTL